MFAIARTIARPALARTFAAPAGAASLHTLPQLPYAYNVRMLFNQFQDVSHPDFFCVVY